MFPLVFVLFAALVLSMIPEVAQVILAALAPVVFGYTLYVRWNGK